MLELFLAGALGFSAYGCSDKSPACEKAPEKQAEIKQEDKKNDRVVLISEYPVTNFGFSKNSVAYIIRKSAGNSIGDFVADEDRKIFSAPLDFVTRHYAEQEINKSRIVLDVGNPIQFMYSSPDGFYVITGNQARVYSKGLEGFVETKAEADMPFDYYKGKYFRKIQDADEKVKERDRLRAELNKKLGDVGVNNASQIRVDNSDIYVVYRKVYRIKEKDNYKLIVETLDRKKLGSLYDKIAEAYGER